MVCREAAAAHQSAVGFAVVARSADRPICRLPCDSKCLESDRSIFLSARASQVLERGLEPSSHRFVNRSRNNDTAGRRLGLKPDGDVHVIAVYVVVLDDQVTQMHANTKHHSGVRRSGRGWLPPWPAGTRRRRQARPGTGELHQRSVPGQLNQSPTMAGERRLEAFSQVALEPGERAALVTAHQARIANDIRCQDRRQTSCHLARRSRSLRQG